MNNIETGTEAATGAATPVEATTTSKKIKDCLAALEAIERDLERAEEEMRIALDAAHSDLESVREEIGEINDSIGDDDDE
jgi:hypothetical protein